MKNLLANVFKLCIAIVVISPAIAKNYAPEAIWEPVPPGMKTQKEVKLTPEEELTTWLADCERKIGRQFSEKCFVQNTSFSVKLSENDKPAIVKVLKTENKTAAKEAIPLIEQTTKMFHPAPNKLPYKQILVIKLLQFPTVKVALK